MYDREEDRINAAFTLLVGNAANTVFHRGGAILPDVVTVTTPQWSICVIDGTATYQQFALQGFQGILGPQNFGRWSTMPLWYRASNWAHECLRNSGANPTGPVLIVGHSYGACAAVNLAAQYREGEPNRRIRYLLFGCPKPGDNRLAKILQKCEGLALINDNDLVGALPPSRLITAPIAIALGLLILYRWGTWKEEPGRSMMRPNGTLVPNQTPILDSITLGNFTARILAHVPLAQILGHRIETYRERIELRCPFPECPVSAALWDFLHRALIGHPGIEFGSTSPFVGLEVGDRELMPSTGLEIGVVQDAPTPVSAGDVELGIVTSMGVRLDTTPGMEIGISQGPAFTDWEVGSSIPPQVGMGLGVTQGVDSSLEIGAINAPDVGMELGTSGDTTPNCYCCDDATCPEIFTVRIDAPGTTFDGIEVQVELHYSGTDCIWQGDFSFSGGNGTVYFTSWTQPDSLFFTCWLSVYDPFPSVLYSPEDAGSPPELADFTCDPWYFDCSFELWVNGSYPSGITCTITVISVP